MESRLKVSIIHDDQTRPTCSTDPRWLRISVVDAPALICWRRIAEVHENVHCWRRACVFFCSEQVWKWTLETFEISQSVSTSRTVKRDGNAVVRSPLPSDLFISPWPPSACKEITQGCSQVNGIPAFVAMYMLYISINIYRSSSFLCCIFKF